MALPGHGIRLGPLATGIRRALPKSRTRRDRGDPLAGPLPRSGNLSRFSDRIAGRIVDHFVTCPEAQSQGHIPLYCFNRYTTALYYLTHGPAWMTAGAILFALGVAAVRWVLTRDDDPD
jgi:hypothetical protein